MTKRPANTEIEIGDFVTIVKGENEGWSGILDNEFIKDGVIHFAVVGECNDDEFYYATEIKLLKKA